MVTVGLLGYPWYMESNFADFYADDVGCLGVSTRIRQLQRPVENENEEFRVPCADTVRGTGRRPEPRQRAVDGNETYPVGSGSK